MVTSEDQKKESNNKLNSTKKEDFIRAVGRHKKASARVRLINGKGEIVINGKPLAQYFPSIEWQQTVTSPLILISKEKTFNISVKVEGGGQIGQAKAIRLGIARTLIKYDEELKKILKADGLLKRDSRVKERKKPGLKKARRAPQWKKR